MSEDALLEAVLKTGVTLPTPSIAFARLQSVASNENAGPREMAEVAKKDPALTGALMRVANSPVFRPRTQARSVQDAITLLGRTRTLAVAVSTALRSSTEGVDARALDAVWHTSLLAAEGAWRCARGSQARHLADQAYLAALLHDVGVPVLLKRFPAYAYFFHDPRLSLEEAVRQLDAGTTLDHAAVGALVARNWKLAPEEVEAIRCHHDAAAARRLPDTAATLATLIAFGILMRDGTSDDSLAWAELGDKYLGLDPAKLGD
ncbi:MAG: HDOD domain-containing protein [Rhodocyclaceae bacterium]|nr:HDOD domain-containing protein [Rhodocyclaceae bacterium]